ncbi:MAG: hypothetical protein ACRCY4_06845 [Brevinema sp.]
MKGLSLVLCLVFAGCVDVTHYISFNEKGKIFTSLRFEVSKEIFALSEETFDDVIPSGKWNGISFEKRTIETPLSEIREFTVTFPAKTPIPEDMPLLMAPYKGGFRMPFDYPKASEWASTEDLNTEIALLMLSTAKYRLILAKKGLKTTLKRAFMETTSGEIPLDLLSFEDIYIVDVPFIYIVKGMKALVLE